MTRKMIPYKTRAIEYKSNWNCWHYLDWEALGKELCPLMGWFVASQDLFQADTVGERPSAVPSMAFNVTVIKVAGWGRDDLVFAEPHCSLLNQTPSPVS